MDIRNIRQNVFRFRNAEVRFSDLSLFLGLRKEEVNREEEYEREEEYVEQSVFHAMVGKILFLGGK
jgi:hypothetical protein